MTLPRRDLADDALSAPFERLREEFGVPAAFPPAVVAAAEEAAARGPSGERADATDVAFVTIDPPGSRDLDQALCIQPHRGDGLLVHYAIADVGAFVRPGDPVDVEAWERGVSRYSPDLVTPLHPRALSEGAASLLPGVDRPAVLWSLVVDADGELVDTHVRRATVRSRAQLTYATAQQVIDDGSDAMLVRLSRLGRLRAEREWVRGGISLELPDQEVHRAQDGRWTLRYRAALPVESWNAQVSLLTGQAAGQLMVAAGVGLLRTLPAPEADGIDDLRRRAWALGLPWPTEVGYADFVRTLDPHVATEAAMMSAAAVGLRGAGYAAFDGEVPPLHRHEAIAATYAHVTAPLRRLVDRYAAEIALAVAGDTAVPGWVTERLSELPRAMARARGRAAALDRAVVDLVEAQVIGDRLGEVFAATVLRSDQRGSDLQLRDPAVSVRIPERLIPGTEVRVRAVDVDVTARTITVAVVA